jgi:hypothetical protein
MDKTTCKKICKKVLRQEMSKIRKQFSPMNKRLGWGDEFADTLILSNKIIEHEHNDDINKGWTGTLSGLADKPRNSNCLLTVTFDGAGYEHFTMDNPYSIPEKLNNYFNENHLPIIVEYETNWAIGIYYTE